MIYGGTRGYVFAIDTHSGEEVWRTKLSTGFFFNAASAEDVMILSVGDVIIAGCNGHIWGLSAKDGAELWHNPLRGLGNGPVTLAANGVSVQYVHKHTHSSS